MRKVCENILCILAYLLFFLLLNVHIIHEIHLHVRVRRKIFEKRFYTEQIIYKLFLIVSLNFSMNCFNKKFLLFIIIFIVHTLEPNIMQSLADKIVSFMGVVLSLTVKTDGQEKRCNATYKRCNCEDKDCGNHVCFSPLFLLMSLL